MTLWLVGQLKAEMPEGKAWEFQGIFDDKQKAIDACVTDYFFVGPVTLNEALPVESMTEGWPGCYYPLLQEAPD